MGSKEWDPETIFDVFASQTARQILALASLRPMSAQEFADQCEHSLPTVYRRLNALQDYDLVREDITVRSDGTQYKVFETNLDRVCFEVEEGSIEVDIQLQHDMVDQFSTFWTDLEDTTDNRDDDH